MEPSPDAIRQARIATRRVIELGVCPRCHHHEAKDIWGTCAHPYHAALAQVLQSSPALSLTPTHASSRTA